MTTSHDKPADTTMMGVVHDALRRDLVRLQTALSGSPPPGEAQRRALAEHIDWMMDFLHRHHHGEDSGLWPLVRQRTPQAGPLLDRMEADHAQITLAVELLRQAAGRYRASGSDLARANAAAALSALAGPLLPHLRGEEDEAMPLVSATLTDAEWRAWDHQHNVRGKSLSQLADEGHWLMDGLDPDRRDVLLHLVPAPVRLVIVKGYARRYRAACARRWGPGVNVAPQPIAA
jgi:hemerythrin-like domain-containing protein